MTAAVSLIVLLVVLGSSIAVAAGMGLVGHNVLHDRSAFHDDPLRPRLLLRARFLDRVAPEEEPWRNG